MARKPIIKYKRKPKKVFDRVDVSKQQLTKILPGVFVKLLPGQTVEDAAAKYTEMMRVKPPKKKRLV